MDSKTNVALNSLALARAIDSVWMPVPKHLPHIVYSALLTSASIHLLWQRKASEDDRARKNAQITILEDLVHQLRAGAPITDEEVGRLKKLARVQGERGMSEEGVVGGESKVAWTEVLWGSKTADPKSSDLLEQRDVEQSAFSRAHKSCICC